MNARGPDAPPTAGWSKRSRLVRAESRFLFQLGRLVFLPLLCPICTARCATPQRLRVHVLGFCLAFALQHRPSCAVLCLQAVSRSIRGRACSASAAADAGRCGAPIVDLASVSLSDLMLSCTTVRFVSFGSGCCCCSLALCASNSCIIDRSRDPRRWLRRGHATFCLGYVLVAFLLAAAACACACCAPFRGEGRASCVR